MLGVLVEKAFTTPDQYPLSLNATTNGCNQKSNRDPHVDFSEAEVRIALTGLTMKHLAGKSVPVGSRVEKWRHSAKEALKLDDRELAVLAELLLRGPQTAGELRGRAKRMRDLPSLDVLEQCLATLREKGYAVTQPEGRAPRTRQTLCRDLHPEDLPAPASALPADSGEQSEPSTATAAPPPGEIGAPDVTTRVTVLEERVDELAAIVARLQRELGG